MRAVEHMQCHRKLVESIWFLFCRSRNRFPSRFSHLALLLIFGAFSFPRSLFFAELSLILSFPSTLSLFPFILLPCLVYVCVLLKANIFLFALLSKWNTTHSQNAKTLNKIERKTNIFLRVKNARKKKIPSKSNVLLLLCSIYVSDQETCIYFRPHAQHVRKIKEERTRKSHA